MAEDSYDGNVATQRAIGRLEGHLGSLDAKVANLETTTDRRLNAVAAKLEEVRESTGKRFDTLDDTLQGVEIHDASRDGKFRGGYLAIMLLGSAAFSLIGIIVQLIALFRH